MRYASEEQRSEAGCIGGQAGIDIPRRALSRRALLPYQKILDELVRSVPGAEGALLLDSEGEVVVQAGAGDFRHRLIGAYQGLALAIARRIGRRHGTGAVKSLTCRYSGAALVLRPLKDGYYFVLAIAAGGDLADAVRRSENTRRRIDQEL